LVKPENKPTLTKILTYHVVPGRLDRVELDRLVKSGAGKAILKTVEGDSLTVAENGKSITVTDDKGGTAMATIADVYQKNGVIHVVDRVLMP
jgi:uncharacterized surface protein with fasciclin (FAS1) repeats